MSIFPASRRKNSALVNLVFVYVNTLPPVTFPESIFNWSTLFCQYIVKIWLRQPAIDFFSTLDCLRVLILSSTVWSFEALPLYAVRLQHINATTQWLLAPPGDHVSRCWYCVPYRYQYYYYPVCQQYWQIRVLFYCCLPMWVCLSVCTITEKQMIRNWWHLVGICAMVLSRSGKILVTFDLDFWPWEKIVYSLKSAGPYFDAGLCGYYMSQLKVATFHFDLWPWQWFYLNLGLFA